MADRHYGYDVKVLNIKRTNGNARDFVDTDMKLLFETVDFSVDPMMKESLAAQDIGPNRRVLGTDFSLSLNKFVEGNFAALAAKFTDDVTDYKNITITIQFSTSGSGATGTLVNVLTLTNVICTKAGFNLNGDATKETLEFKRGTGSFSWGTNPTL